MAIIPKRKNPSPPGKVEPITNNPRLDIGTLVFGLILLYIIITLILYLTQKRIAGYEVVEGTIAGNYRYTAIALKEEEIETSDISGAISYYAREGTKANVGMVICSVGAAPLAGHETKTGVVTTLSDETIGQAKREMTTFAVNFSENMFSKVYDFKSDLQGVILQSTVDEEAGTYVKGSYEAPVPGFVVYSTDDLEGLTSDQLSRDYFSMSSYKNTNLRLNTTVNAGDPIYKLVTNDTWELCFPIDDALKRQLEDVKSIHVRFLKDNETFSAPIEMIEGQDGTYAKITLKSSLVRYVTDRYLEIELIMSRVKGLKIPVSSVTEKTFLKIPEEYVEKNENTSSEIFLTRETFAADGSSSTSRVTASVYSHDTADGYYLIHPGLFEVGDYVVMPGTTRKYQISDDTFTTIQGVYNINKGYAVFREVTIVDENEAFCIVEPGNVYSLSAHDRIVLDASKVDTDDIIN